MDVRLARREIAFSLHLPLPALFTTESSVVTKTADKGSMEFSQVVFKAVVIHRVCEYGGRSGCGGRSDAGKVRPNDLRVLQTKRVVVRSEDESKDCVRGHEA